MEIKSTSDGMPLGREVRRAKRLMRLIADLLSVYHRKEHLCRIPQFVDRDTSRSSADAQPPSSLRVEEFVTTGPSTGPEHLNRTCLPVLRIQPCVAPSSESPPSEATWSLRRERKARKTWGSVATCSRPSKRRRCDFGSVLMWSARVPWVVGFEVALGGSALVDVGEVFQYGIYRRYEDVIYRFQMRL